MDIKLIINKLPYHTIFDKQSIREVVHGIYPDYNEHSMDWLIKKLKAEKLMESAGKGKYIRVGTSVMGKPAYTYRHSAEYLNVEKRIANEFPFVTFQMWEFIQFNEFVNHQISKNILVVEVESMLEDAVFEFLRDKHPHVLFCPNMDEFYRYRGGDDTIVILKLISEAPRPVENHSSPLENLLVNLFTNKFPGKLIPRSEYQAIFEESFSKYMINEAKLFRYAKRRNNDVKIKRFIEENTGICLLVNKENS